MVSQKTYVGVYEDGVAGGAGGAEGAGGAGGFNPPIFASQ